MLLLSSPGQQEQTMSCTCCLVTSGQCQVRGYVPSCPRHAYGALGSSERWTGFQNTWSSYMTTLPRVRAQESLKVMTVASAN